MTKLKYKSNHIKKCSALSKKSIEMIQLDLEKGPVPKRFFFQEVKKVVCLYALLVPSMTMS